MRTDDFVDILTEVQVSNLRTSVEGLNVLTSQSIPKLDGPISCSATAHEHSMLVRRPSKSFDSCNMIIKLVLRNFSKLCVPHKKLVVISS